MPATECQELDLAPKHLDMVQAILAATVPHAEVWAYGSRVRRTSSPGSDLDLVVRNPDAPETSPPVTATLRAAFADSNLPINVDVLDWARVPQEFRDEIQRAYIIIQHPLPS